jgi:rhodanese-related sulfurtransferase
MDKMVRVILYSILVLLLSVSCQSDNKVKESNAVSNGAEQTKIVKVIPPSDFLKTYKNRPGAVMVDVRTPKEFVSGKIVPEAENVDYHADTFLEKILMYDRDTPIFVYCFSGGRSAKAVYKMKQLGFKDIYECEGGYQKWEREKN